MRKLLTLCVLTILVTVGSPVVFAQTAAYNFGDFRSSTLASKAWTALSEKNLDAVLAYTNKCIEMYEKNAITMQAGLKEYPAGDDQKVFSYWALNDVATNLFIQGEAYRQAGKNDKAKEAFQKIIDNFSFGQCWDPPSKTFWKPADAAKEKIAIMESGLDIDFGDMSSSNIVVKAWGALNANKYKEVKAYVDKVVSLYADKAKEMQSGLKEFPWESKDKIFSYWALNDVGTAYFIQGEAYRLEGKKAEAIAAFQKLINEYSYAQCWDPQGWFWKPAEAAQQKLAEMEATK
jgi:tetratricopeptide (TPR) repeat protein